jgi:hypothetical protein
MATPVGHSLIGLAIARRLGVRSGWGSVAAVLGASLPDADILLGLVTHRDPYKFHRKTTHTPGFALGAGMAAGWAGLVSAGNVRSADDAVGDRDLIVDAFTGAAIVGSHLLLDFVKVAPYVKTKRGSSIGTLFRNEALNFTMDALIFAPIAWLIWPRD